MKKIIAIGILAIVGIALLGMTPANAAPVQKQFRYTRTFSLFRNGLPVEDGSTLNIERNGIVFLDLEPVYGTELIMASEDVLLPGISDEPRITVGVTDETANQAENRINVYYSPSQNRLTITAQDVVDHVITIQLQTTAATSVETTNPPMFSAIFYLHVKTGETTTPTPNFSWLRIPKAITLRHLDGSAVISLNMKANDSVTLYVDVDSGGGDPQDDFLFIPISPATVNLVGRVFAEEDGIVNGRSTITSLISSGKNDYLPTRITTVHLNALNEGGTEGSTYDPQYTRIRYELEIDGTAADGSSVADFLPDDNEEGTLQTQLVNVRVTAEDDGASGTCAVSGLGVLALAAVPLAFLRKKSA